MCAEQAYFNGHDHDLQLLRESSDSYTRYVTTGAGSLIDLRHSTCTDSGRVDCAFEEFYSPNSGFVSLEIGTQETEMKFWIHAQDDPTFSVILPHSP